MAKTTAEGGEPEDLSVLQLATLSREVEALKTPKKTLSDLMEEAGTENIKSLIAPGVLAKLNLAIASFDAQTHIDRADCGH